MNCVIFSPWGYPTTAVSQNTNAVGQLTLKLTYIPPDSTLSNTLLL